MCRRHARDADAPAGVNLDLHGDGDVSLVALVLREADAAPATIAPRLHARIPVEQFRDALDGLAAARIAEIGETKSDRVLARHQRHLVHHRLDGETIADLARRAQMRGTQRRAFEPMHLHLQVRDVVGRLAARTQRAGGDARDLLRFSFGGRQKRNGRQLVGRLGAPHLRAPGDDLAVVGQGGFLRDHLRGSLGIERMLILARPLHADRLAHRARQEGSVGGGILVGVHAVAASAIGVMHARLAQGNPEHVGEMLGVAMCALRRTPDRRSAVLHVGDGAGRAQRRMALHRPVEVGGEFFGCGRIGAVEVAALVQHFVADLLAGAHIIRKALVVDGQAAARPCGLEQAQGAHRIPFIGRDDAKKILDPHHLCAGNAGDGRLVHRHEAGTDLRRSHDAAMQHAGNFDIVHIFELARDLCRNVRARHVLADEAIGLGIAHGRFRIELQLETLVADQAGEGHAGTTACFRAHFTVDRVKFACRAPEFLGTELDKGLAGGRSCLAQLHAALGNAVGARRRSLVGRQRAVALDQLDATDWQPEFFRRDLREGGAQAGAEIDLAGIDRRRAVGMEREIGIDLRGVDRLGRGALRERGAIERNGDEERAGALQKCAARGVDIHPRDPPEARTTALTMRSCVPQRHRFWASASLTCASLGFALRSSRAALVITMPVVQ